MSIDRDSWIAGYAAALRFCEDDEGRPFGMGGDTPEEAAALAWEEREREGDE